MAIIVDHKTKLTYKEYALFPDDGMVHELIDGEHMMTPAPGTYHQTVSRRLQFQLYEMIELKGLGQVFDAPTDVELTQTDIVQPDILVVLSERQIIITPTKIIDAPDLMIEIISESSRKKDQELKLGLYQQVRVPEYWLVDPESHTVKQYVLEDGALVLKAEAGDTITYEGLPDVTVNLDKVW